MKKLLHSKIWLKVAATAVAIVLALAICVGLILLMDIDPIKALAALWEGSFSSINAIAETMVKMTPLLFTGMSYALAGKCGLTNLGMEGQLYGGALAATAAGIYFKGLPATVHIPIVILCGFIGGAVLGIIAGYLKVKFQASEIITTVMLNSVAKFFAQFMVEGPMIEPSRSNTQTLPIEESAQLGRLIKGTRAHWGFVIAIGVLILFWLFLWKSKKGYEVRVSGYSAQAARYVGINIEKNICLVMFIAGGIAGLAGCIEIMGVQIRMMPSISPGYGFDGIAVALIGNNTPIGILFGALLFGAFRAGGNRMMMRTHTPTSITNVMQAVIIIMVICSSILLDYYHKRTLMKTKKEKNGEKRV